ncbi:MAG: hypothetical protein S4CHLAM81_13530 [Chlamydiales bacterium]|nr:hypothetical protein [Chlamydiales bacterium]
MSSPVSSSADSFPSADLPHDTEPESSITQVASNVLSQSASGGLSLTASFELPPQAQPFSYDGTSGSDSEQEAPAQQQVDFSLNTLLQSASGGSSLTASQRGAGSSFELPPQAQPFSYDETSGSDSEQEAPAQQQVDFVFPLDAQLFSPSDLSEDEGGGRPAAGATSFAGDFESCSDNETSGNKEGSKSDIPQTGAARERSSSQENDFPQTQVPRRGSHPSQMQPPAKRRRTESPISE